MLASANAKYNKIKSYIDPKIPKDLLADSLRINQVLSNFLSNAIKFTKVGGHISVESTCRDSILNISVHDNGIGISAFDIKNIFTAFTQAEQNNVEKLEGTGLGLSICNQLAQHMGGSVHAESTYGLGSKIWVEIPVDAHSDLCPIYEDVSSFQYLKIAVYSKDTKNESIEEWFLRYADEYGKNT